MEKKDWEKELEEIVNNIDIKKTPSEGDWIDKQYKSATKNVLIEFIKQLLEEREMMVYHEKTISNMEKKVIEKLGIPKVKFKIGYREKDGSNELELKIIAEKINEIIDVINKLKQ